MNQQQKSQIIKSFAYGMTDTEIADVEGLEVSKVAELRAGHQDEIAAEQEWQKESGYEGD